MHSPDARRRLALPADCRLKKEGLAQSGQPLFSIKILKSSYNSENFDGIMVENENQ